MVCSLPVEDSIALAAPAASFAPLPKRPKKENMLVALPAPPPILVPPEIPLAIVSFLVLFFHKLFVWFSVTLIFFESAIFSVPLVKWQSFSLTTKFSPLKPFFLVIFFCYETFFLK